MKILAMIRLTRFLFFTLTTLSLIVSCSSSSKEFSLSPYTVDEWVVLVDGTIKEQERAAKVKQLGFQLLELADSATGHILKLSERTVALNENYETTLEEFQKLSDEYIEAQRLAFIKYREIIFAMRSEVSEEEWNILSKDI
jgi:hypothetical protein